MENFPSSDSLSVNVDWRSYIFDSPVPKAMTGKVKTRLGVDFNEAEKASRSVMVGVGDGDEVELVILQRLGNDYNIKGDELGVGAVVWDAAIVLGRFLER